MVRRVKEVLLVPAKVTTTVKGQSARHCNAFNHMISVLEFLDLWLRWLFFYLYNITIVICELLLICMSKLEYMDINESVFKIRFLYDVSFGKYYKHN